MKMFLLGMRTVLGLVFYSHLKFKQERHRSHYQQIDPNLYILIFNIGGNEDERLCQFVEGERR